MTEFFGVFRFAQIYSHTYVCAVLLLFFPCVGRIFHRTVDMKNVTPWIKVPLLLLLEILDTSMTFLCFSKRFEELDTDNSGILDEKVDDNAFLFIHTHDCDIILQDIAEVEIMEKEKMRQLSAKISQLKKDRGTLLGTLNATWSWIAKLVMRKRSTETPKDHESAPQKQSSVISVENPMMTSI